MEAANGATDRRNQRLIAARKALGWTQADLAGRTGLLALDISRQENSVESPWVGGSRACDVALKIAIALCVSPSDLWPDAAEPLKQGLEVWQEAPKTPLERLEEDEAQDHCREALSYLPPRPRRVRTRPS